MNEDRKITRNDLETEFEITGDEVVEILLDLASAGLVSQHAKSFKDVAERNTWYKVTTLGKSLYGGLIDVFIPKLPKGKVYKHG